MGRTWSYAGGNGKTGAEEGESGACAQVRDKLRLAGVQLSDTEAEWAGKGDG